MHWIEMLKEHRDTLDLCDPLANKINDIAREIHRVRDNHGKVLTCGNGGSFSHAQHFAAELVVRYRREREPMRSIALGSNAAITTAICNDLSPEDLFFRELGALADQNDCLVAFTTSGKSSNILHVLDLANHLGVPTIAITGMHGILNHVRVKHEIRVPSEKTSVIQQVHTMIIHALCEQLDA